MKKIICLVIALTLFSLLSTQAFASTYYDINIEGLTASEKREVTEWLEDEGYEYDVNSYSSSDNDEKVIIVEDLSLSEKDTLVTWLKNRDYEHSSKKKNGDYYVTIEYTNSTKSTLVNYLDKKEYYYDTSNDSNSSDREGKAYLVANGTLWYADGDDIQKVDGIYSPQYVLFTEDGGISYIEETKKGMIIQDLDEPTESEQIAKSANSINTNSSGYATAFRGTGSKTTRIESDDDFNNDEVTVYVVKNNTLYSLSSKNDLKKLKSLKSVSGSNRSNIGFSEWGDLVFIDSSGVCFFNEEIDDTDEIQTLKDQNKRTVKAKYFTVRNGIVQSVTLFDGSVIELEDD